VADFELDRLDFQILSALQQNNQASAQDLAERVPLSPSAILRRIRGYRASGVITADVSVLAPNLTGERIRVLLMIQLETHAPQAVGDVRGQLVDSPNVQMCLEVSGVYDIACLAVFRSMEEFNVFADATVASHPAVRRYEASFVKRDAKLSLAMPL
jgi:Lrp/AsnC family leucine-responsive transcriptional regulator